MSSFLSPISKREDNCTGLVKTRLFTRLGLVPSVPFNVSGRRPPRPLQEKTDCPVNHLPFQGWCHGPPQEAEREPSGTVDGVKRLAQRRWLITFHSDDYITDRFLSTVPNYCHTWVITCRVRTWLWRERAQRQTFRELRTTGRAMADISTWETPTVEGEECFHFPSRSFSFSQLSALLLPIPAQHHRWWGW